MSPAVMTAQLVTNHQSSTAMTAMDLSILNTDYAAAAAHLPDSEILWHEFLVLCVGINQKRDKENEVVKASREEELRSLDITPSQEFLAIASKYDEKEGELTRKRTEEDAQLIRALYKRAISHNPYLLSHHSAAGSPGVNYAQHQNLSPQQQHPYATVRQAGMKVEHYEYENGLGYVNNQAAHFGGPGVPIQYGHAGPVIARPVGGASVSRSGNIQKSYSASGPPRTPIHKSSPGNRSNRSSSSRRSAIKNSPPIKALATSTMANLYETDFLVEHPPQSGDFYVLTCPLCSRRFESAHGMYTHINQSDRDHLDLFDEGKKKCFNLAVEIGGTLIIDATSETAKAQNVSAVVVSCVYSTLVAVNAD
jgi:hypothetical protein